MGQTRQKLDASTGTTRKPSAKQLVDEFGLNGDDMSVAERRSAISGYDMRHRIEAMVAGITAKKIRHVYKGDGAATAPGFMILPRIPATHLFPMRHVRVLLGYTAHEISHQLKTDFGLLQALIDDKTRPMRQKQQIKEFWNAIEDYRIEKLVRAEYPGFHVYIDDTRDFSADRFCERVKGGMADPKALANPYRIGAVALTWIGAELNHYKTGKPREALNLLDPDLLAWLETWRDDMAAVETCLDARDLAITIVEELDRLREHEPEDDAGQSGKPKGDKQQKGQSQKQQSGQQGGTKSDGDDQGDAGEAQGDDAGSGGSSGKGDSSGSSGAADEGGDEAQDGDAAGSDSGKDAGKHEADKGDGSGNATDGDAPDGDATGDTADKGETDAEGGEGQADEDGDAGEDQPDADAGDGNGGGDANDGDDDDEAADEDGKGKSGDGDKADKQDGGDPADGDEDDGRKRPDLDVKQGDELEAAEAADLEIDDLSRAIRSIKGPEAMDPTVVEGDEMASASRGNSGGSAEQIVQQAVERGQQAYSAIRQSINGTAARSAGILRRMLMSQTKRTWRGGREEGDLDFGRLVPMAQGMPDIYKQRVDRSGVNTALTLLLDNSGSMTGHPISVCQQTAVVLDMAIQGTPTKIEIVGFTGCAQQPVLYRYRTFGQTGQSASASLGNMDQVSLLCTPVSTPLLESWRRLSQQKEPRRIMIVVSDGGADWNDVKAARQAHDFIVSQGCRIIGIAVGCIDQMKEWCDNCQAIESIDDLPVALTKLVQEAMR